MIDIIKGRRNHLHEKKILKRLFPAHHDAIPHKSRVFFIIRIFFSSFASCLCGHLEEDSNYGQIIPMIELRITSRQVFMQAKAEFSFNIQSGGAYRESIYMFIEFCEVRHVL
jgi:hypothetical protein